MMQTILQIFFIAGVTFLPVVFWGYTFSYIDPSLANKKRFLVGVLAGAVSVIPVLYFDKILGFFSLNTYNIFFQIYRFYRLEEIVGLNASILGLLLFVFFLSFFVGVWLHKKSIDVQIFFKNLTIFLGVFFLISIGFYGLSLFFTAYPSLNLEVQGVFFQDLVFSSIKLVIFYYFVVAVLEEASKHFHFLSLGTITLSNIKVGVLYAIFVALGFSFAENILYFSSFYQAKGIGYELVKVYFFRSSFALIVHLLCSSFIAYFFTKAYLQDKKLFTFRYIQVFCFGVIGAIFLHAFFDIALTLGISIIMFIYFVCGYLYITSIFYKNSNS